jgi:hypothetical protein
MSREFQTSLNVLGINITLRPFLKQNTPYVIYLYELNRIPSLNNRLNIAFIVFPVNAGEESRPLRVRIKEHKHNLKQGLLEKSKSKQHAYVVFLTENRS